MSRSFPDISIIKTRPHKHSCLQGRDSFSSIPAFPPFLVFSILLSQQSENTRLHSDDNGVTGPDWGHSEVVFKCFPRRRFQPVTHIPSTFAAHIHSAAGTWCPDALLCHVTTFYSSLLRVMDYYNRLRAGCQMEKIFTPTCLDPSDTIKWTESLSQQYFPCPVTFCKVIPGLII